MIAADRGGAAVHVARRARPASAIRTRSAVDAHRVHVDAQLVERQVVARAGVDERGDDRMVRARRGAGRRSSSRLPGVERGRGGRAGRRPPRPVDDLVRAAHEAVQRVDGGAHVARQAPASPRRTSGRGAAAGAAQRAVGASHAPDRRPSTSHLVLPASRDLARSTARCCSSPARAASARRRSPPRWRSRPRGRAPDDRLRAGRAGRGSPRCSGARSAASRPTRSQRRRRPVGDDDRAARALEEWLARSLGSRRLTATAGALERLRRVRRRRAGRARSSSRSRRRGSSAQTERWDAKRARYDLVIVDGPACGHAVGMLRTPAHVRRHRPRRPDRRAGRRVGALLARPARSAVRRRRAARRAAGRRDARARGRIRGRVRAASTRSSSTACCRAASAPATRRARSPRRRHALPAARSRRAPTHRQRAASRRSCGACAQAPARGRTLPLLLGPQLGLDDVGALAQRCSAERPGTRAVLDAEAVEQRSSARQPRRTRTDRSRCTRLPSSRSSSRRAAVPTALIIRPPAPIRMPFWDSVSTHTSARTTVRSSRAPRSPRRSPRPRAGPPGTCAAAPARGRARRGAPRAAGRESSLGREEERALGQQLARGARAAAATPLPVRAEIGKTSSPTSSVGGGLQRQHGARRGRGGRPC